MNKQCKHQQEVERWFDGELNHSDSIESHIDSCESCKAHVAFLNECRDAVTKMPAAAAIADAQMPAFLEGISDAVHTPRRRYTGIFALASALTAALLVAISTFSMFTSGPDPVGAETVIEKASTEIDGATVEVRDEDSSTTTVWLNLPEGE